jgi:hypothetical protein
VFIDEPLALEGCRTAFLRLRRMEAERLHVSFKLCDSVCLSRSGKSPSPYSDGARPSVEKERTDDDIATLPVSDILSDASDALKRLLLVHDWRQEAFGDTCGCVTLPQSAMLPCPGTAHFVEPRDLGGDLEADHLPDIREERSEKLPSRKELEPEY